MGQPPMMRRTPRLLYAALLAGVFAFAVLAGWTTLAAQVDTDVYDFLFRLDRRRPPPAASVIYGIDERTLRQGGGLAGLRGTLADGLDRLGACEPGWWRSTSCWPMRRRIRRPTNG